MVVLGQRPGLGKYAARIYSQVSALPWGSDESSVFTGASPSVANGDMSSSSVTSPGGFDVNLTSTGVVVIDTLGSSVRQSFYTDVYDVSLRKWYGDAIQWVNNALPVYDGSVGAVTVREGEAMSPVSVAAATTDADGDVLTYAIVGGSLPPGLTLDPSTGIITGTP